MERITNPIPLLDVYKRQNYKDINRNFSILSESEKELFFKTIAEDFERFHSFALQRMATNPTITGEVYNNLLRNKGLLLKSGTAMRNAILGSGDEKLIQLFENWIQEMCIRDS